MKKIAAAECIVNVILVSGLILAVYGKLSGHAYKHKTTLFRIR